jgi:hypothetical protein
MEIRCWRSCPRHSRSPPGRSRPPSTHSTPGRTPNHTCLGDSWRTSSARPHTSRAHTIGTPPRSSIPPSRRTVPLDTPRTGLTHPRHRAPRGRPPPRQHWPLGRTRCRQQGCCTGCSPQPPSWTCSGHWGRAPQRPPRCRGRSSSPARGSCTGCRWSRSQRCTFHWGTGQAATTPLGRMHQGDTRGQRQPKPQGGSTTPGWALRTGCSLTRRPPVKIARGHTGRPSHWGTRRRTPTPGTPCRACTTMHPPH